MNTVVLGALVGGVIYNPDTPVWYLLFAFAIWTAVNVALRYMMRFRRLRRAIKGDPVMIVRDGRLVLDDCYNANPQSVTAALEVLGRTDCERRVAVLGDMGELGDLTDQAHFNAGALAAMLGIDFVIAIGSKAARIADGAAMSGGDVVHFATKEEALPTVREQLRPNTSMLIKASHSMRFERLTEDLRKYYD